MPGIVGVRQSKIRCNGFGLPAQPDFKCQRRGQFRISTELHYQEFSKKIFEFLTILDPALLRDFKKDFI